MYSCRSLLCSIIVSSAFFVSPTVANIRLLQSDESGVVIECLVDSLRQVSSPDGGVRIDLPGAGTMYEAGMPQVPVLTALVGIPPGAVVSSAIDGSATCLVPGVDVAICPPRAGSLTASFAPEAVASVGEPAWFRDMRVVQVVFTPVRYSPSLREMKVAERTVVRMRFDRGSSGVPPGRSAGERERAVYEGVVLNSDRALGWLDHPPDRPVEPDAKRTSVDDLSSGIWVKVVIKEEGIYRILGSDLERAGVSVSSVPVATIRLLSGGGEQLPLDIQASRRQTLQEVPILVEDGSDGKLDSDDVILFYGTSVSRWVFDQSARSHVFQSNAYTRENVYWLTYGGERDGLRMPTRNGRLASASARRVGNCTERLREEADQTNRTIGEGVTKSTYYDTWYWEDYEGTTARSHSFLATYPEKGGSVTLRVAVDGIAGGQHGLSVALNSTTAGQINFQGEGWQVFSLPVRGDLNDGLNVLYLRQTVKSTLSLDWFEVEYVRRLTLDRGELKFAAPLWSLPAEFTLGGVPADERLDIFEVSDPFRPARITDYALDAATGAARFQDTLSVVEPHSYVAVVPTRWKRPVSITVAQQRDDLRAVAHGADYIIISPREFADAAEELALWRGSDDRFGAPLKTAVVFVEDIYDQFSWGLFDPTAIRDFVKYAFERWNPAPVFVVLLGDGTYDYKNNTGLSPGNWIPPYEEGESTLDEWYVRVRGNDDLPDLAIGRLSVRTTAEARAVVEKIVEYDRNPEQGVWRNTALLVGDDEKQTRSVIEPEFTKDAEDLSDNFIPRTLDREKVYLMEFEKEGQFKPAAERKFIEKFNKGAVLMSYVGHGNPDVLAHEHVFQTKDVPRLANGRKLPFVYFAASAVGQFDKTSGESLPEALLKATSGGAIGSIGGTRIGYHQSNMMLNRAFYQNLFLGSGTHVPVGLALMRAKPSVFRGVYARGNTQRYSLFGDPATIIGFPESPVSLPRIRQVQALGEVRLSGQITGANGAPLDDFDGNAVLQAFDSATEVNRSIARAVGDVVNFSYLLPGSPIFRSRVPVRGGRFDATFRVPKDVSYGGRFGRISAFLWNDRTTGAGSIDSILVAGTDTTFVADNTGPTIDLGFEGQEFADGDYVSSSPDLVVRIIDRSGINIAGDVGHEIQLGIDDDPGKNVILTDRFVSDSDTSGSLSYRIEKLSGGEHTLEIRAWDNANNSSYKAVRVRIAENDLLLISDVLACPNPATGPMTEFTYNLTQPAARVDVSVYGLSGSLVTRLVGERERGYNFARWDLPDDIANGVYLFKISAQRPKGGSTEAIDKIVIMR